MSYILCVVTALLTFISPCVLPMLPIYISYFAAGDTSRKKTLINAIFFCIGMTLLLCLFGVVLAALGFALQSDVNNNRWIVNVIGGIIIVTMGLNFIEVIKIPFLSNSREIKVKTADMTFISALVFGMVYAISFGPCAIAFGSFSIVATISDAIKTGNIVGAMMYQLIFALTLSVLFIASALLIDLLKGVFAFIKRHYRVINIISGSLLIVMGILMMLGIMDKLSSIMT